MKTTISSGAMSATAQAIAATRCASAASRRVVFARRRAWLVLVWGGVAWVVGNLSISAQQQVADPAFSPRLRRPAYAQKGPIVTIDQAHGNAHTASGRYKPFADLLAADGYTVIEGTSAFDRASLRATQVLVIANAGSPTGVETSAPAFTSGECDIVRDWVRDGGALLLIADHSPYGVANGPMAQRFGVTMGNGWVFDRKPETGKATTQLVFSAENGGLGTHPIVAGRGPAETVKLVKSFSGQSLSVPADATALLRFPSPAREALDRSDLDAAAEALEANDQPALEAHSRKPQGPAQGIALRFGKGRVVIFGEAAMFSAQVVKLPDGGRTQEMKIGMNEPGNDNQQFALNVLHWLSGTLK